MSWSLKLGRIAGIEVKIHFTFLLLLGWVGYVHWQEKGSAAAVFAGLVFILALFGCVVLHELGHALAARRYGIRTRDIILLPIGGVARMERIPENPVHELVVAAAGPLVNVAIAALLYPVVELGGTWLPLSELVKTEGAQLQRLTVVNIGLVVFNLIPAFPMDGGRMLRALLALRMNYTRATQIAATVGQGLAVVFGLVGLLATQPMLIFIALFVWIGAAQEASMVLMKESLAGIPVEQVMLTDFRVLHPGEPLERAVELTLAGSQRDFPVVDEGKTVGILTQSRLLEALAKGGRAQPVSAAMERDFEVADRYAMIEPVLRSLQERHCRTVPVVDGERLAGLLTLENVGEFYAIKSALKR